MKVNTLLYKCKLTMKELFLFNVCVFVILTIGINHYGDVMESRQLPVDVMEYTNGRLTNRQIKRFGRSLSQHGTEQTNVTLTNMASSILSRLLKIESRLLRHSRRPALVVLNMSSSEHVATQNIDNSKHSVEYLKVNNGLTWLDSKTITQGNWSVVICADGVDCPADEMDRPTPFNWIKEIQKYITEPASLCHVVKKVLQSKDESPPCMVMEGNKTLEDLLADIKGDSTSVLLMKSGSEIPKVINVSAKIDMEIRQEMLSMETVVYPLPQTPLLLPRGPVLRIDSLVTSFMPLRFYLHPIAKSGPYLALTDKTLFKEQTVDRLLEYISETYGLGTSAHWWNTIQQALMKYFLCLSISSGFTDFASRRFQQVDVDIVCDSIRQCTVLQISTTNLGSNISSIIKMFQSPIYISPDLADELDNEESVNLCMFDGEEGCLTEQDLEYLIQDKTESIFLPEWIKIFPSKFGHGFLSTLRTMAEKLGRLSKYKRLNNLLTSYQTIQKRSGSIRDQRNRSELIEDADEIPEQYDNFEKDQKSFEDEETKRACSNDNIDYKEIGQIHTVPQFDLQQTTETNYHVVVPYHILLLQVHAVTTHCKCQTRIENKYNTYGPKNVTLGLGDNVIHVLVLDMSYHDPRVVSTVHINVHRKGRGLVVDGASSSVKSSTFVACGLKQECSFVYDTKTGCGLQDLNTTWKSLTFNKPYCRSGDQTGRWVVPCLKCQDANSCYWKQSRWQPNDCKYRQISSEKLKQCLKNRKLLFIGDSTNRGILNYIMAQVNGSLWNWDKTHNTRTYTNVNNNMTAFTFAYYPHFWLPVNHRPTFYKLLYQLIKSSLPLENNANTVLVIGGVQWLTKHHVDMVVEALQSKGLSNITKVVKGLGAGFHQPVKGVKYVPKTDIDKLQEREADVLQYSKHLDFHTIATFNMTMARYGDFLEGKCACHFHKVTRLKEADNGKSNQIENTYKIDGNINEEYSQIMLNQICN